MKSTRAEENDSGRRAGGYPYMPLSLSMRVSDALKELGGARSGIPKSLLAKHLNESEKSPTFSQRITSAKCFGLVEGHGTYVLSETAKKFYFPTTDSSKTSALLEMLSAPDCFKELIRRFDGDRVPTKDILGNILHRELGVPESWKDRVASFFFNSAQFVGVIDSQGFLRCGAAWHSANAGSPEKATEVPADKPAKESAASLAAPLPSKPGANTLSLSHNGQTIYLQTPEKLEIQLWRKLEAFVALLKPSED
jgi:hypothetical protein